MCARDILIRGTVQGVGFRPYIYRLAREHSLSGWVANQKDGVHVRVEGSHEALEAFTSALIPDAPPAAHISALEVKHAEPSGFREFFIRESERTGRPTVRISPDLPVCDECLAELFDETNPRYLYPYINCTNCGPRFSVIESLPYDRCRTTMRHWSMDELCDSQYHNPLDRRFHAQPVACPNCGPHYLLEDGDGVCYGDRESIDRTVQILRAGAIVAVKGIGGYHLSCDAANAATVQAMRERKFRKQKPFAVMVRDVEVARRLVELSPAALDLLTSTARPIVLAPGRVQLAGVAPENSELGIMLPYAPLHHLLFAFGAPEVLVMTSANRSSEPIAFRDDEARRTLTGLADAFLVGERPIARRVDDSVARAGVFGPAILRRSRGYAPDAVGAFPTKRPILAVGADLKNTITLVVDGQAFTSQHIGDLDHYEALASFRQTLKDLLDMYAIDPTKLTVAHDIHPQYASTLTALALPAQAHVSVQHHRAHVASVLAERGEWERRVIGVSFDGTGYGEDGTIWGGEFFAGSLRDGFTRVGHLRPAYLPGGDAAAAFPVQCAAGFLTDLPGLPDLMEAPFQFPGRYRSATELVCKRVRTFSTTSVGRLFDTAAALLGFTGEITFEGQAAIWLEQLAGDTKCDLPLFDFTLSDNVLDFRPMLVQMARDRYAGAEVRDISRRFHRSLAYATARLVKSLSEDHGTDIVALSGGVFQNELLLAELRGMLEQTRLTAWTNAAVPTNDGGISLGQAALAVANVA